MTESRVTNKVRIKNLLIIFSPPLCDASLVLMEECGGLLTPGSRAVAIGGEETMRLTTGAELTRRLRTIHSMPAKRQETWSSSRGRRS